MEEHIFERFARERGITVEEMRGIISARIERGGKIYYAGILICKK